MKLKQNLTLEIVHSKLRQELSTYIVVKIVSNPFNKNIKWIEVNKDAFVGLRIFLTTDDLKLDSHIPSFLGKMFFGGIISGIFHHGSRRNFKQRIAEFLITEFYEE